MLQNALRWAGLHLIRLFYPQSEVLGREHVPSGPAVFVANHPNGLLDPLVMMAQLGRPLRFLAAGYLFRYPIIGPLVRGFGALPVVRPKDVVASQPKTDRNAATFAACRRVLRDGGALALFPEGTTHSGGELLPLKSGAARITLGAEHEDGAPVGIQVVPVGLWYRDKSIFRSAVLVVVGAPFPVATPDALTSAASSVNSQAVDALTDTIKARLDGVVLQTTQAELLRALPVIARWIDNDGTTTLTEQHQRTAQLLLGYHRLTQHAPARLDELARQARRFARLLRTFGIDDPWTLELPPSRRLLAQKWAWLVLGAPLAAVGWLTSYPPYHGCSLIAARVARDDVTQVGHTKLMAGLVLLPTTWLILALVFALLTSWPWGVGALFVLPLSGYIALRWSETKAEVAALLRSGWLRQHARSLTAELIARRRALAENIAAALNEP